MFIYEEIYRGLLYMYFPYFRGKQYELMALRGLVEKKLISKRVTPIIEPIKFSTQFIKTVKTFINSKRKIVIIHNPQVGEYPAGLNSHDERFINLLANENVIVGHIVNSNSKEELELLKEIGVKLDNLLVINNNNELYEETFKENEPKYIVVPGYGRPGDKNIILQDKFNKQKRNADYGEEPELFSYEHIIYDANKYCGFSDYSLVGSNYTTGGGPAYAIALHILYYNKENILYVRHFVSDSKDGTKNQKGKFLEAVGKFSSWLESNKKYHTYAINELLNYYNMKHYPGAGMIKKLSIMHHLEIMSRYLEKKCK